MKTLKNHLILYDSECPMCNLYTHAFTVTGMLDENGRAPYQSMPEGVCPLVDRQRAVNEIALVNTETGEVRYGIESLFAVIATSFPVFRPLFSWKPFARLMRKAYAFVSYNRKVIIPARAVSGLQPSFSLKYRIAYLIFTWLIVGCILTAYAPLLPIPQGGPFREYLVCGGQILFQGIVLSIYAPAKRWDYLGNMMTISLAGALLLCPIGAFRPAPLPAAAGFMLVAGLMFFEHIRRAKLLGLGWLPTITWAVYRLLILALILYV